MAPNLIVQGNLTTATIQTTTTSSLCLRPIPNLFTNDTSYQVDIYGRIISRPTQEILTYKVLARPMVNFVQISASNSVFSEGRPFVFSGKLDSMAVYGRESTTWTAGEFFVTLWNSTGQLVFQSNLITTATSTQYSAAFHNGAALGVQRVFLQSNININLPIGVYELVVRSNASPWSGTIVVNVNMWLGHL